LAIEAGNHIASLQTTFGARRIRLDLGHDCALCAVQMEELRVLRRNVADADSHISMADFSVTNQCIYGRTHDLGRNGETHAGKRSRRRNQESIDSHYFAFRVNQRSTGVTRIDGGVCLNELAGLAAIGCRWIWAIQGAHDSARNGKAITKRITESEHHLSRMQLG